MAEEIRVFTALSLSRQSKKALMEKTQAIKALDKHQLIRWISEENLHLTLHFLGEQPLSLVQTIAGKLADKISSHNCFRLHASQIFYFPMSDRPKVIAAYCDRPDELLNLKSDLDKVLNRFHITNGGQRFSPHISLARLKNGKSVKLPKIPILPVNLSIPIDQVTLYQSQLTPQGARYTPIQVFPLA